MSLLRLAQVNLALAAVLGTLLLGAAQGSLALPALAVLSAAAALYWTDLRGRIRLGGGVANLAALAAVAVSVSEVVQANATEQLVAIANLLIYLQTILLFQEKTVRVGWQLLSLSLLQVVVAAAIDDSIVFGVLVILYLVVGLSGVALLCCYGESLAHRAPLAMPETKPPRGRRLGRAAREASLAVARAATVETPPLFYCGLVRCLAVVAAGSVAIAALLFVLSPRQGQSRLMAQTVKQSVGMTAFTDKVDLNSSGRRIFEDDAIVMRVELFDDATGQDFDYPRELFLRGGVAYEYGRGNWQRARNDEDDAPPKRPRSGVVRQQIEIEPMTHDRLFSVYPVVDTYGDPRVKFGPPLRREGRDGNETRMQVNLGTSGFHRGSQHPTTPCSAAAFARRWGKLPEGRKNDQAPQSPEVRWAGLIQWATDALDESATALDDRVAVVQALEARLKYSGEFGYSLALPERDPAKDPIEDFVTTHRQGNCEFFASALVLMLRSRGIPARIVMGYRSADWNPVGGYLQVRQLHAHAWAEAFLEPDQIPEPLKSPHHDYSGGAWLRLDPTPGDENFAAAAGSQGFWARVKNLYDHVDLLWRNYVIGYDRDRQERFVYEPLERVVDEVQAGVVGFVVALTAAVGAFIGTAGWLGLAAAILAAWIVGRAAWRLRWRLPARWWAQLSGWFFVGRKRRKAARRGGPRVAFYERFERIAAWAGYRRLPQQTPLEFAQAVGGQLFDMPSRRLAARAPRQVVEAYYRVRYGGHALADEETAAVERALGELESVLMVGKA